MTYQKENIIVKADDDDVGSDIREQISLSNSLRFSSRVYSPRHNPCHAAGLIIFASLYTFLYGGGFFGWGPMQLLLEQNGSFSWKCNSNTTSTATGSDDDTSEVCYDQAASLLKIQFVGILSVLTCPILGYILDKYEVVSLMSLLIVLLAIGFAALLIAVEHTSPTIDQLLYPAFFSLGIVAQSTNILSIQAGVTLYPYDEVSRLRVISLLNALFDSGSVTYLGLWALANGLTLSLPTVVWIYAGMAAVSFFGGLYFWIVLTKNPSNSYHSIDIDLNNEREKLLEIKNTTAITGLEGDSNEVTSDVAAGSDNNFSSSKDSYVKIADRRPYYTQMLSEPFLWLCFFFAMHFMNNSYTLTTMRDFLAYLGDDEYNNRYLTIFTILLPISISGVPMVDYIIQKHGFYVGFQCINILSMLQNGVKLFSSDLNVQIIGFVAFIYLRCFLFCITLSYVPVLVSPQINGKCVGIMCFTCGLSSFLNIPLANLAMQKYDGNFFVSNSIATILVLPCLFAAYRIGVYIEKEKQVS